MQNYVEWLSALLLAHKYHIVSLTIEWITETGNFLPAKTQQKIFWLYTSVGLACALFILTEDSLIWKFTLQANLSSLLKTETCNSIISITFLAILTLLFSYSYVKITRTLATSDLNMSINKTMLTVNFTLLLIILFTWALQWLLYGTSDHIAFYTSYGMSTVAKLVIRVVFLALIESFGQKLNLRSKMTAKGELVIYGCDETGK